MLASLAPFPCPGAPAFLKPDGVPVRIHQHRPDGRVLISRDEPSFLRSASTQTTVDFVELAETRKDAIVVEPRAIAPTPRPPRRARRAR